MVVLEDFEMSKAVLGELLAEQWLAQIPPFSPDLVDKGERFKGCPVFQLPFGVGPVQHAGWLTVYRYPPFNSERSYLAFLPGT